MAVRTAPGEPAEADDALTAPDAGHGSDAATEADAGVVGSAADEASGNGATATEDTANVPDDTATAIAPEAPPAVRDPATDREQRLQALRSEVDQLNARFADRVFVLPGHKAANLNRDHEAYLKPKS